MVAIDNTATIKDPYTSQTGGPLQRCTKHEIDETNEHATRIPFIAGLIYHRTKCVTTVSQQTMTNGDTMPVPSNDLFTQCNS